jgi:hypothetical protein
MSSLLAKNVGTVDRVARIALGIVLLSLAFTGPQSAWGYLGFIPLITGALGTCPLYSIFGWNTCAVRQS